MRYDARSSFCLCRRVALIWVLVCGSGLADALEPGCPGSSEPNPSVLFCDDFDDGVPIADKWNAYSDGGGRFTPVSGVGVDGSTAMQTRYDPGTTGAGRFSIALGGLPAFYLPGGGGETWQHVVAPDSTFRELYWRQYLKLEAGWSGIPRKFSRIRVLSDPQPGDAPHPSAFQGQFWQQINTAQGGTVGAFYFNNTRGVDENGTVIDRGNNTGTSIWLPQTRGSAEIFVDQPQASAWICIEGHVRLNEPGMENGVEEFWIDGQLDAQRTDQNHLGTYTRYGINQVIFESYWNGGSPQTNFLYRDNIVLSTERIGCLEEGLPAAEILDDGTVQNLDSGSTDDYVFVRSLGCGPTLDPCPDPGPATTATLGQGVVTGAATVRDDSSIVLDGGGVAGDLSAFGDSHVEMSSGAVFRHLIAVDRSSVELTGGWLVGFLAVSDDASVVLRGGGVGQFVSAADGATIEIAGTDFAVDGISVPYGDLTQPAGFLTGTLESGEPFANAYFQGDALGFYSGTVRLVPEPSGPLSLCSGVALLAWRVRRRRASS